MKRKILAALLACVLLAGLVLPAAGEEVQDAPLDVETIRIASAEDFLTFAENCALDSWSQNKQVLLTADISLEEMNPEDMEMIVLPGGLGGVASIRASEKTLDMVRYAWSKGCFVAAICAGPTVLADLGITEGKHATCYPGQAGNMKNAILEEKAAVRDGKIITGASAGCAVEFALALIEALRGTEAAEMIRTQIVIR